MEFLLTLISLGYCLYHFFPWTKFDRFVKLFSKSTTLIWKKFMMCRFVWDEAKYPTVSPLREIVDGIHVQVAKIEDDLKACSFVLR